MAAWLFSPRSVPGVLGKSLSHGAEAILDHYLAGEGIRLCVYLTALRNDNLLALAVPLTTILVNIDGLERFWGYLCSLGCLQLALHTRFFGEDGLGFLHLFPLESFPREGGHPRGTQAGFKA